MKGEFQFTTMNMEGCDSIATLRLKVADELAFKIIVRDSVKCFGDDNGRVEIETASANVIWEDGYDRAMRGGLGAGTYRGIISNEESCEMAFEFTLTQPEEFKLEVGSKDVNCEDDNSGTDHDPEYYRWDEAISSLYEWTTSVGHDIEGFKFWHI